MEKLWNSKYWGMKHQDGQQEEKYWIWGGKKPLWTSLKGWQSRNCAVIGFVLWCCSLFTVAGKRCSLNLWEVKLSSECPQAERDWIILSLPLLLRGQLCFYFCVPGPKEKEFLCQWHSGGGCFFQDHPQNTFLDFKGTQKGFWQLPSYLLTSLKWNQWLKDSRFKEVNADMNSCFTALTEVFLHIST